MAPFNGPVQADLLVTFLVSNTSASMPPTGKSLLCEVTAGEITRFDKVSPSSTFGFHAACAGPVNRVSGLSGLLVAAGQFGRCARLCLGKGQGSWDLSTILDLPFGAIARSEGQRNR